MRVVVAPFHRFSSLVVSNVYLLDGGPGDRWLIDTGHWSERWQLLYELRATGLRPTELTGVLLTHRHSDHAGNAAFLQREYGVKVLCHRADAEVLVVGLEVLRALGVEDAQIHVNHRWILTGLIAAAGVAEQDAPSVIRAVDKLDKIGPAGVAAEIVRVVGSTDEVAATVLAIFAEATDLDALDAIFARAGLDAGVYGNASGRLRDVLALVEAAGHPGKVLFDASIARGLDYYTGIIYETRLTGARVAGVGAVMSGGRYDHLIGTFGKTQQPAVGLSLGLDRLLAALRELGLAGDGRFGADVFIAMFGDDDAQVAMQLATTLRRADIGVELATKGGKLGKQLEAADKRGCAIALVLGPDERAQSEVVVKHLRTGEQRKVGFSDLVQTVNEMRSV